MPSIHLAAHIKQIQILFTGSQADAARDLLISGLVLRDLRAQWPVAQSYGTT